MKFDEIERDAIAELKSASTQQLLEEWHVKFLGRKAGLVTNLFKEIPHFSLDEKREQVPKLNKLKGVLEKEFAQKLKTLEAAPEPKRKEVKSSFFDPSLPGKIPEIGHSHPSLAIIDEIKEIFHYLGFGWIDGPELETDLYNFQKLRLHKDHPARDMQQTYYVDDDLLLRTHTSNMQVRYLEKHQPPVRMLFPGRVFRREAIDSTHLPAFLQLEGLLIDTESSLTDLLGVIEFFLKKLFGEKTKFRVYGHHFPYTEPSIEVELLYKGQKWLEIMGAGMVHPEVLKNAGINPKKYQGWAFGMGPERIAMLRYGIEDIRLFYSSDMRFLKQF